VRSCRDGVLALDPLRFPGAASSAPDSGPASLRGTMSRNDAFTLLMLGRNLERADMTSQYH